MNDVGRDVDRDFRDCIDLISVDAEFRRFACKIERADRRDHDLKPHRLVRGLCGRVRGNDVAPNGLERGREICRECKRTTGILESRNVNLLSHRLFIRYIL